MTILEKYIGAFGDRRDLVGSDAEPFLDALIDEADEPLLADVFRSWNEKGISEDEIYCIARILRDRCTRVRTRHETFVDIVGTGGSRSKTFNVSTAAAFVVAGAGLPVAKHGNRAATSSSGSADVLDELGVEPAVDATTAERCLDEIGICFMFAPNFHRLSPTLAKVRRGLGFPTIFNCVGPLCNPASAPHQVIGVWEKGLVAKMANALARLGTKRSWIVHAEDGLDEISIAGTTLIGQVDGSRVSMLEIRPDDFGIAHSRVPESTAASATESARVIRSVLDGGFRDSATERLVLINAAAALYLSGRGETLSGSYDIAGNSLRSGAANEKLSQLARATQKMKTTLDTIVDATRARTKAARGKTDVIGLHEDARAVRVELPANRLRQAVMSDDTINVIAEFKRASPSKGVINNNVDPRDVARSYEMGGACAISVLTETDFFQGSLDDLRSVRQAVSLPILRKDFIIDEFQIFEAAAAGADAVLLIVAVLSPEELERLQGVADELGLDALVEVHTLDELEIAKDIDATLIGVNNRDLKSLEVSLDVSRELIAHAPPNVPMIAESGLTSRDDLVELKQLGYSGFLIGETLMQSGDPASTLRGLVGTSAF